VILAALLAGAAYFVWSHLKDRLRASSEEAADKVSD
jgi:hypothetical protein